jgi:diguanylate cyclase (GGDEF)-like protein
MMSVFLNNPIVSEDRARLDLSATTDLPYAALLAMLLARGLWIGLPGWMDAAIALALALSIANLIWRKRHNRALIPSHWIVSVFALVVTTATWLLQPASAMWAIPVMMAAYVTTPQRFAAIFSTALIGALGVILRYTTALSDLLLYLPALIMTGLFMHASIARINLLQEQLVQAGFRDPLTLCHNRRYMEHIRTRDDHAQTKLRPILFDLDKFKQINDALGHYEGDRVLTEIACQVRLLLPKGAHLLRLGGDEFLILAPAMPDCSASDLANRLRKQVTQQVQCDGFPVTISVGIGDNTLTPNIHEGVMQADRALLHSKRSGRDQVNLPQPAAEKILA